MFLWPNCKWINGQSWRSPQNINFGKIGVFGQCALTRTSQRIYPVFGVLTVWRLRHSGMHQSLLKGLTGVVAAEQILASVSCTFVQGRHQKQKYCCFFPPRVGSTHLTLTLETRCLIDHWLPSRNHFQPHSRNSVSNYKKTLEFSTHILLFCMLANTDSKNIPFFMALQLCPL